MYVLLFPVCKDHYGIMMLVTVTPVFFMICLARQDNPQLHYYLEARNPKKDPTLNLSALLAKPIVVCCKYFTTQLFKHLDLI